MTASKVFRALPCLCARITPIACICVRSGIDRAFHEKDVFLLVKSELAITDHEFPRCLKKRVNFVMRGSYGAMLDVCILHQLGRSLNHTLTEHMVKSIFITDQLCQALDLVLISLT